MHTNIEASSYLLQKQHQWYRDKDQSIIILIPILYQKSIMHNRVGSYSLKIQHWRRIWTICDLILVNKGFFCDKKLL